MAMKHLILPEQLKGAVFLPFMAELGSVDETDSVRIDFSGLRRITPGGLAALSSTIMTWRKRGQSVDLCGFDQCPILGYLQRMDLLKMLEINLDEEFQRHASKGRFVPVRRIEHDVQKMGAEVADCLAPGGAEYTHPLSNIHSLVWYVLTETANNVRQHSSGSGFMTAQVNVTEGFVRLAISDNGKGIRRSFLDAGLPWAESLDDTSAILKALESRVSSKGAPTNEGVGLTLVRRLAELTDAWLLIVSGCGVVRIEPNQPLSSETLPDNAVYPGTLIAWVFPQNRVGAFDDKLHEAKEWAGLLQSKPNKTRFCS